jgi:predicted nucleic acid-binding Zn ribbon protein
METSHSTSACRSSNFQNNKPACHTLAKPGRQVNKSTNQHIGMRKSQTQKIGDVIRDCLNELHIARKLKEVSIVSEWETLMGKTVANRTEKIYIKNRTLFVHVRSSVLKTELLMMRQDIMNRVNENAGETIIDQIVIK